MEGEGGGAMSHVEGGGGGAVSHVEGEGGGVVTLLWGHRFPHLAVDGDPSENIKLMSGYPSPRPEIPMSSV